MAPKQTEPQTGRETRFLVLVVGVAVIVLLLLAQWQFPASSLSGVSPSTAPLAGLAARATFDEMASTMADVVGRVSTMAVVVPLERTPVVDEAEGNAATSGRGAVPAVPAPRDEGEPEEAQEVASSVEPAAWALALRVRRDVAVVHVPEGYSVLTTADLPVETVVVDGDREVTFLRVAISNAEPDTLSASIRTFPSFSYVAVVGATPVGPTVQPAFFGRADTVSDPRWSHALVPASAIPGLVAGAFVFSLDSRLIGLAIQGESGPMIVPAPALEALVQSVESLPGEVQ